MRAKSSKPDKKRHGPRNIDQSLMFEVRTEPSKIRETAGVKDGDSNSADIRREQMKKERVKSVVEGASY